MEHKIVRIILKIVRILLPAGAMLLCTLPGSYQIPVKQTEDSVLVVDKIATNYLDPMVHETGNWMPILFVVLCAASVVLAVICSFQETEKTLTWLTGALCLAMVADLATLIFMDLTPIAWVIAGLMGAAVALTAYQEIQLEKKGKP